MAQKVNYSNVRLLTVKEDELKMLESHKQLSETEKWELQTRLFKLARENARVAVYDKKGRKLGRVRYSDIL